jgi:predicted ATPase
VREYAAELLASAEPSYALRRRHRDYYLSIATRPVSPQWSQIQKQVELSRELENLRAALAWSADNPSEVEDGLRLATELDWSG